MTTSMDITTTTTNTTISSSPRTILKRLDIQKKQLESESEAIVDELTSPPPPGEDNQNANAKPMGIDTPLVDAEGYPRADIDLYRARDLRRRLKEIQLDHKKIMKSIEENLVLLSTTSKEFNPSDNTTATTVKEEEEEQKARMAQKPKPKFDPITKKWVVQNWNGTVAGIENGHLQKFDEIGKEKKSMDTDETMREDMISSLSIQQRQQEQQRMEEEAAAAEEIVREKALVPFAVIDHVFPNSPAQEADLRINDVILQIGTITHNTNNDLRDVANVVQDAAAENGDVSILVLRGGLGKDSTNLEGDRVCVKLWPKPWAGRGLLGCHLKPL